MRNTPTQTNTLPLAQQKEDPKQSPSSSESNALGIDVRDPSVVAARDLNLSQQLEAAQERYLRLAADFDNFRKRTARDAQRSAAEQKEAFIRELLPVLDNLERGLAVAEATANDDLRRGMHLVLDEASRLLREHGLDPQDDCGKAFDPHLHEAVEVRAGAGLPPNTVVEVWQRGWRLTGRPFRPAKVVVSVAGASQKTEGREE